jgi:hypothetical protein
MAFVKLFSSITESSLWGESKDVRLLFVSMLAKADATGFVEAALPGLARISNLSVAEAEAAIAVLESPDKYSKCKDFEGRRVAPTDGGWIILNYDSYRNRRNDEERQAYMRDLMRSRRATAKARREPVSSVSNPLANVSRGYPQLAHAEAEAEAEDRNNTAAGVAAVCIVREDSPRARESSRGNQAATTATTATPNQEDLEDPFSTEPAKPMTRQAVQAINRQPNALDWLMAHPKCFHKDNDERRAWGALIQRYADHGSEGMEILHDIYLEAVKSQAKDGHKRIFLSWFADFANNRTDWEDDQHETHAS